MSKRNIFTVIGLVLSFVIATGGWLLTSRLMNIQSERLLSGATSFLVNTPVAEPIHVNNSDYPNRQRMLLEHEIVSVLQNWSFLRGTQLHEPAIGQISMEQAIIAAREGIVFLRDHGILPEELLTFNDTRAYLSQNIDSGLSLEPLLPIEYSYWTVSFSGNYLTAFVTINAVTGQIWGISVATFEITQPINIILLSGSEDELKEILFAFMSNLELQQYGEIEIEIHRASDEQPDDFLWITLDDEEITEIIMPVIIPLDAIIINQSFAGGRAIATINVTGVFAEGGELHFSGFHMSIFANHINF
ncbi:MAG: hypothetical protein FWD82_09810 [Defluviitaleaceae bacterium]|nr:hypothetical protein [Defluviitaleaceae bacterium]